MQQGNLTLIWGERGDFIISDFRISSQSFIKENCHHCRTSVDIDMKFGPVTKLDKGNKTTSKKLTLTSYRKIMTSLSFFRFLANLGAIQRLDSGHRVCKSYVFSNRNLLSYENSKQN